MRVPESTYACHQARAELVGRVRIALLVCARMMLAVTCDPFDDGALHREGTEDREQVLGRLVRLKRPVGQKPVKANRGSKR